ncbi:glycosyltransferase family 2 protein [Sanguibacter suarezii]|uniref:glycosyltransferase family 2 protein n=1 Tax=Sanguibacter suarezii TaxID=60921 RepID=UPI003F6EC8BC
MADFRDERVLIIIPAWNEEETLGDVLDEVAAELPSVDVVVVDDGSTDRTSEVARAKGVRVLQLPINLGVGGAMRAGYKFAARNRYTYTVQLDADGQHPPKEVPTILDALVSTGADVMIGARFAGAGDYQTRGPRRWSMTVLSVILSRVTRAELTDTTSGFKACGPRAISLFSTTYPAEYLGDTVEALVIAARGGLTVDQTGVSMRPRAGGRPSHSPVKAAVFLVRALLALGIALTRPGIPTEERPA